ncbi:MAG: sorbosone dehydrogenase family protein [Salinirussus sp.]
MQEPTWSRRALLATAGVALAGCATGPGDNGTPTPAPDPPEIGVDAPTTVPARDVEPTVLVENLEIPWDIAVAPDGDLFITERVGRVNRFSSGQLEEVVTPDDAIDAGSVPPGAEESPWWVEGGEGGTLGAAVHPDYPDPALLYVYYTARGDGEKRNRVSRFDVTAANPGATEEVIIDDIPAHQVHNGGRIRFGPEGHLWVTTGTASYDKDQATARADDPGSLAGKVLRLTQSGDAAPGNPGFADPRVYTIGHRNPQGIVRLPGGAWLVNEHGGTGHDEINRLVAGADYGWPNSPRGREKYVNTSGVHPPLANTGESAWAPSGSVFYTGNDVPSWSNRMLIGGLVSQQVIAATIVPPDAEAPPTGEAGTAYTADWYDDAATVVAHPLLRDVLGRVRHLEQGQNGALYAITSNRDGRAQGEFPRERDDVLVRLDATTG